VGAFPVVTNDIEIDPSGDVAEISEKCWGKRMRSAHGDELRAGLAQPITKIAGRRLIEINDVGVAAIDRKIT
jgi:hypothetical protein